MTIQRMDHVGVVVDDLEAAISFFIELGMELDGGTAAPPEGLPSQLEPSARWRPLESTCHTDVSCGGKSIGRGFRCLPRRLPSADARVSQRTPTGT
jgi:catechol 2,3-dioxygenase-like lactoylglutathione lyase family enzyme